MLPVRPRLPPGIHVDEDPVIPVQVIEVSRRNDKPQWIANRAQHTDERMRLIVKAQFPHDLSYLLPALPVRGQPVTRCRLTQPRPLQPALDVMPELTLALRHGEREHQPAPVPFRIAGIQP